MFEKVNRQAVELLAAAGADVIAPRAQSCCGAIHHHNGAHRPAEELAKRNIDTFLPANGPEVDFIATNMPQTFPDTPVSVGHTVTTSPLASPCAASR